MRWERVWGAHGKAAMGLSVHRNMGSWFDMRGGRMSIERPSTRVQDRKVLTMWRQGVPRKQIAHDLVISYHQVTWAFRRKKRRELCRVGA